MAPIRAAIDGLRERAGQERAISVVHTDLPDNDFAALFRELASGLPANPSAGLGDAGWSSWAVQWLSRAPGPIPDQLQVAFSHDPAARSTYAAQAVEDWRSLLAHRAAELMAGGRLVVLTMALDATGDFGYRPLLAAMYAALGDLVASGEVRGDEAATMAIPTVGRSRADLLAPFDSGRFRNLRIVVAEVFEGADRIWADFERDRDAHGYAER